MSNETTLVKTRKSHSPKLRFKEFKEQWTSNEVGNFVSLISGYAFQSELFSESGNKLMTPKNFTKLGRANFDERTTKFTSEEVDNKFVCIPGDLLVLLTDLTPSCELLGKPVLLTEDDGEVLLNQRIVKIVEDEKVVNKLFLANLFQTETYHKRIKETSTGTTVRHSSNKILLSYQTFLPQLPEQQKIASFLSAVDEKIQQLTRKKELLAEYKKGVMQQLFSGKLRFKDENGKPYPKWEEKRLGDVISAKSEKHNPQKETYSYKCIELEHLSTNTGMLLGYVDSSGSASIKNKFKKGDVLFGKLRPYLKKYLIAPFDGVCSSEIWVLTGKGITNEFLYRLIQTEYFIDLTNQSTGSKMPRAEWNVVSSGVMEIPSLEEQQKIASFLTALDAKIESVATQIAHTQTFKKGLLQQMFV